MGRMSERERDLHKRQVRETQDSVSRSQSGRKYLYELARANPGIIFTGGGGAIFVTPEDERTDNSTVTCVKLTKNEKVSGAMIKDVSYTLRVDTVSKPRAFDEFSRGFREYEPMMELFYDYVPNVDERDEISIPVEFGSAFDDMIEKYDLNKPDTNDS